MPHDPGLSPAGARAPGRNAGLILLGVFLLLAGLAAGVVFLVDLNQYLTIAETLESDSLLSDEARRFGISVLERAAVKRMTLFGPLAAGLNVTGLALLRVGLRRK